MAIAFNFLSIKKTLSIICIFFVFGLQAHQSSEPHKRKTICLNMIIKNESEVIERCLDSIKHLIDYWVIFDTGSTDGTQKIVEKCLKDIPGELHESPWVNFAHNRNEALAAAKNKADYLLFIDADEIWQYSRDFDLPHLDKDCYNVTVRQLEAVDFKRVGLVNNHLDWKWQGVLHEIVDSPQAQNYGVLERVINICNAVKGSRTKDPEKYLKDAIVLEQALKKEPTNSRYVFYLAQSYLSDKKYELALKNYKKRTDMESKDVQETYMAMYNVGIIQEKLDDDESALESFFKAYEYRPTRAEPLLRIATIYRKKGNCFLGYLILKYALSIPYPADDLCVEYMPYGYAILVEFANCTLLSGRFQEGLQACCQLLANSNLPANIKKHVVANCELARKNVCGEVSCVQDG